MAGGHTVEVIFVRLSAVRRDPVLNSSCTLEEFEGRTKSQYSRSHVNAPYWTKDERNFTRRMIELSTLKVNATNLRARIFRDSIVQVGGLDEISAFKLFDGILLEHRLDSNLYIFKSRDIAVFANLIKL